MLWTERAHNQDDGHGVPAEHEAERSRRERWPEQGRRIAYIDRRDPIIRRVDEGSWWRAIEVAKEGRGDMRLGSTGDQMEVRHRQTYIGRPLGHPGEKRHGSAWSARASEWEPGRRRASRGPNLLTGSAKGA